MKFTAKAYLAIDDDTIEEIWQELYTLGYEPQNELDKSVFTGIIIDEGKMHATADDFDKCQEILDGFINCREYSGECEELAIFMLLELAKMRSDTDEGQWFEVREPWGIWGDKVYWSHFTKYSKHTQTADFPRKNHRVNPYGLICHLQRVNTPKK